MAKEYIERDVAIEKTEAFCDVFVTQWTDEKVLAWIRNLPAADVVEVVRCKDCKYLRPEVDAYTQEVTGYWCCLLDLGSVEENHFCSYGERRDNNADDLCGCADLQMESGNASHGKSGRWREESCIDEQADRVPAPVVP